MSEYVFLDPDGTQEFGLAVIVAATTGVVYAHQCGGLTTLLHTLEGFVIPIGGPTAARPLRAFFRDTFQGNPPAAGESEDDRSGRRWTAAHIDQLHDLLGVIAIWATYPAAAGVDDRRGFLRLDLDRLDELTEAWIPVCTPYGPGVLVFSNSD